MEACGQQREYDVPCGNGGKTTEFQENDHGNAGEDEYEFDFIVAPRKILEFQGEHGDFRDEQETRQEHGERRDCLR